MNPTQNSTINPLEIFDRTETERLIEQKKAMLRAQAEQQMSLLSRNKPELQQSQQTQGGTANGQPRITPAYSMSDKMLNGKYPVTQRFGNYDPVLEKESGGIHYGTDFATPLNTPIALPDGQWIIQEAVQGSYNKGYGNSVVAVNQETGEKLRFSHLNAINANPGQTLQGRSVIGYSGTSGNSTGPHIDIEYYTKSGKPVDILSSSYANQLWQS